MRVFRLIVCWAFFLVLLNYDSGCAFTLRRVWRWEYWSLANINNNNNNSHKIENTWNEISRMTAFPNGKKTPKGTNLLPQFCSRTVLLLLFKFGSHLFSIVDVIMVDWDSQFESDSSQCTYHSEKRNVLSIVLWFSLR